jgi:hypothetical protein
MINPGFGPHMASLPAWTRIDPAIYQNWIHSRWLLPRSKETYQISLADCPKSGLGDLMGLGGCDFCDFDTFSPLRCDSRDFVQHARVPHGAAILHAPVAPLRTWSFNESCGGSQKITYRDIILPHITTYYHFKRRTYMIGNRDTWVDTQFWDIDRTCRGALKRSSSQFQGTSPERSLQHEHP